MMIVNKNKLLLIIMITFFIVTNILFFNYHTDFYFGQNEIIAFINSDSKYYIELAQIKEGLDGAIEMFLGNKNLFGQLLYFDIILNENLIAYFMITMIFFIYAIFEIYKNTLNLEKRSIFFALLLINPVILTSLSGPNKEITGFISILFLINFILNRKLRYIFFSLSFALFTRFELLFVVIFFIFLLHLNKRFKYLSILLLIVFLSLIIPFNSNYMYDIKNVFPEREGTLGLVDFLAEINMIGGYIITLLPKLMINFYGELLTGSLFNLEGYSINIYISQILFLFLSLGILYKKKFSLDNPLILFLVIYLLVFNLPPFIQHRYFISIYPILVLILFSDQQYKKGVL